MGRVKHFTNRKKLANIRRKRIDKCTQLLHAANPTPFNYSSLKLELLLTAHQLPPGWHHMEDNDDRHDRSHSDSIILFYVLPHDTIPEISHSIIIKKDLTYTINAYQQNISIPNKISLTSFRSLLLLMNYVNGLKICPGNAEEDYLILADERDGLFKNKQGITIISQ